LAARLVADRYELLALLESSARRAVWDAYDRTLHRSVLVSVLAAISVRGQGEEPAKHVAQALRRAGALARVAHPALSPVYDAGTTSDGQVFLVTTAVPGRSLAQVLREDGPPTVSTAMRWTADVADALASVHRADLAHGDISPDNIFLSTDGDVRLIDFGSSQTDMPGIIPGSPHYLAPEAISLVEPVTAAADVYRLGTILYELLTGQTVFEASSIAGLLYAHVTTEPDRPSLHRSAVPRDVDDLVLEMLSKHVDQRPPATEVRDRLRAASKPPASAQPPVVPATFTGSPPSLKHLGPSGPATTGEPLAPPPQRTRRGLRFRTRDDVVDRPAAEEHSPDEPSCVRALLRPFFDGFGGGFDAFGTARLELPELPQYESTLISDLTEACAALDRRGRTDNPHGGSDGHGSSR
jgi:serine/threonine-protein kinase